ncbi:MAG TPA: GNAT family N-acetyltransferase [Edaphocola sp.]|nr:GNAT family N-acetyltransferase [Edaphocola sp.]
MEEHVYIIRSQQPEYLEVLQLRHEVLRAPLGLNLYQEDLSSEIDTQIFIYKENQKVIACLLALPVEVDTIRLKQMAVAPEYRGKGIGHKLLQAVEAYAMKKDFSLITFHARCSAIPFYEKMGYQTKSPIFEEVGLPHQIMEKNIQ